MRRLLRLLAKLSTQPQPGIELTVKAKPQPETTSTVRTFDTKGAELWLELGRRSTGRPTPKRGY